MVLRSVEGIVVLENDSEVAERIHTHNCSSINEKIRHFPDFSSWTYDIFSSGYIYCQFSLPAIFQSSVESSWRIFFRLAQQKQIICI